MFKLSTSKLLLKHARKNDLTLEEFIGFIKVGNIKEISLKDLLKQMQGYKIVLTRGFPFKFTSLAQFNRFKKSLLNGLKKVGIPIEDVRIQGSSLRKAPPLKTKDVDLVVFIEDISVQVLGVN